MIRESCLDLVRQSVCFAEHQINEEGQINPLCHNNAFLEPPLLHPSIVNMAPRLS
jgi:hypothetical protein